MALMARTVDVVVSDWMFAAVQRAEDNLSLVRPDPLPSATVDALLDDVMLPRGVRQLRSAGTPRQPAGHAGAVLDARRSPGAHDRDPGAGDGGGADDAAGGSRCAGLGDVGARQAMVAGLTSRFTFLARGAA